MTGIARMNLSGRRGAAVALVVMVCVSAADAQTNSRFRKARELIARPATAAPTTQPAAAQPPSDAPPGHVAPQPALREPRRDPDAAPPANEALLMTSLIAVEPPPRRKLQVNDLITVIVREDLRSSSDATLKQDKSWDLMTELSKWIRVDGDEHLVPQHYTRGRPDIGFKYDDQYEGKGKTERKDTLITRIQARVVDVKPNGTLIIEAKRRIRTGEDVVATTLTGTCRSEDVTADNSVLSTQVYDLNIENKPEGAANDAAERGWIKKLVDFLKPL